MAAGSVYDSDDDEDLRRAIALSLEDVSGGSGDAPGLIALSSSDEDNDDLEKAPIYRRKDEVKATPATATMGDKTEMLPDLKQSVSTGLSGLVGLDRRKMEEDRLARVAKRKAPGFEQEPQGRPTRARTGAGMPSSEHGIARGPKGTAGGAGRAPPKEEDVISSAAEKASLNFKGLRFPKGVVKKTWVRGYPRTGDDIKIEEILQKDELQLAVISSFQWDDEWMLSKIDVSRTKMVCIAFAAGKEQERTIRENAPNRNVRFCFPHMGPMGSMHSKLQLLKFPGYLRVVVPSGNMVPYDWGETGVLDNIVFIIDLPRIEDPSSHSATRKTTSFYEELCYFLTSQGLEEGLVKSLQNYDFSETSGYAFIHTIAKTHVGDSWKRTGYCGLGRAVAGLGLGAADEVEIDYVTASLGAVSDVLISAIYQAARGDDGLKEYGERIANARTRTGKTAKPGVSEGIFDENFRIHFPSLDTVVKSRGSRGAAGTICAHAKWWDSVKFPRRLVRDCENVRPGLLTHSKMILVRTGRAAGKQPGSAWAYIGSANLSESAWGRLTKNKQTGSPQLTCRNWECGVIVTAGDVAGSSTAVTTTTTTTKTTVTEAAAGGDDEFSVFLGSIPVPIMARSEAYGMSGSRRPWLYLEDP